jgi:hypothetical protein
MAALGEGDGLAVDEPLPEPPVPEPPLPEPLPAGEFPIVAPPPPHATSDAIPIARVKSVIGRRT